jgi:hypothetical protein
LAAFRSGHLKFHPPVAASKWSPSFLAATRQMITHVQELELRAGRWSDTFERLLADQQADIFAQASFQSCPPSRASLTAALDTKTMMRHRRRITTHASWRHCAGGVDCLATHLHESRRRGVTIEVLIYAKPGHEERQEWPGARHVERQDPALIKTCTQRPRRLRYSVRHRRDGAELLAAEKLARFVSEAASKWQRMRPLARHQVG